MTLRDELIQVAAVAVAIVQDLDFGSTDHRRMAPSSWSPALNREMMQGEVVLEAVRAEWQNQLNKWGPQHHTPEVWLAILAKEVGEVAGEVDTPVYGTLPNTLSNYLTLAEEVARQFLKERFEGDPPRRKPE